MNMMTQSWMPYFISQPLVMLARTVPAAVFRIKNLEFSKRRTMWPFSSEAEHDIRELPNILIMKFLTPA